MWPSPSPSPTLALTLALALTLTLTPNPDPNPDPDPNPNQARSPVAMDDVRGVGVHVGARAEHEGEHGEAGRYREIQ